MGCGCGPHDGPLGMDIAAGEYGYDTYYFRRMLEGAPCMCCKPNATRCGGVTGFMKASELCDSFGLPFLGPHRAVPARAPLLRGFPRAQHRVFSRSRPN